MSKTCYQNITPTKNRELDVFEDMSPQMSHELLDTDCPIGNWTEDEPNIACQNPDFIQKDCYRCDGMYREKLNWCIPPDSDVEDECPKGFKEKKMACNYPLYTPPTSQYPYYQVPSRPCTCVNSQGMVDGYSLACCPQEAPKMYPQQPIYTSRLPQQRARMWGEGLPWFSWIVVGGLIYWAITKYDVKLKSK